MKTKPLGPRGPRALLASNRLAGRLPSTLLAASLLIGCAPTTTQVRSVESPARVRLVRPEPEVSLDGEFRYEAGAVVGRLAWQNACRREEVRRVEKQKVNVTPLITKEASALYIAIGAAVVLGGAVVIAQAGDSSSADYHSCSDTSDDECKSPRQLYTEAGIGLIATGLGIGGLGVVGLAAKPRVELVGAPTVEQKVRTIESDVACGKPRSLAGVTLLVSPPGAGPPVGTVDEEGALRIELGPGSLAADGARVPVEVSEVPEALTDVIPPGTVVGEVLLPPTVPVVEAPRVRGGAKKSKGPAPVATGRSAKR